jgi:superfamily II DNA or RNA helicase
VTGNVIFSNWLEFGVNVIEKFLKEQHITYAIITGETPIKDRKVFVELYNEGKINTLVISSAGGTGLDLRGTQNIIILDPVWNASQLDQIIGRGVRYMSHAHLPKEKQKVNIYLMTLVEQAFISGKQEFSRSGDYLLYNIIEKKRQFGKLAEDMLKKVSIL